MKNQIIDFLNRHQIVKESRILLAVSGGQDSVALFDVFKQIKNLYGFVIGVAHVNHNLRPESENDADFVRKLAIDNQCEFFLKECIEIPSTNIEAWGRQQRYDFFNYILRSEKYDWLVTAHTASDQAETLLLKLLANRELQTISEIDRRRSLIRPLISITREQVAEYVKINNLKIVEDLSNQSSEFLRNVVRNEVIPFLDSKFEGNLGSILAERAAVLNEDLLAINLMSEGIKSEISAELFSKAWKNEVQAILKDLPMALSWRIVELIMLDRVGFKIGRSAAMRILPVIFNQNTATELPGGFRFTAEAGGFNLISTSDTE